MCLIAFAWQAHAEYPLIVAGNRDEFFARPTAAADWWPGRERLGGRDLRAGGTWMGVSRHGRFAALTNHRNPAALRSDAPSRGELVGAVLSTAGMEVELDRIADAAARYNGFNLIAAEWTASPSRMWVLSAPGDARRRLVEPGVHALSNAHLDTPWPKVDRVSAALRATIGKQRGVDALVGDLFEMLADDTIADDDALPRTGVSLDTERALSAPFIRMPGYGTRASTVVMVDRAARVTFVERTCEPDGPVAERRFSFQTEAGTGRALNAARAP